MRERRGVVIVCTFWVGGVPTAKTVQYADHENQPTLVGARVTMAYIAENCRVLKET